MLKNLLRTFTALLLVVISSSMAQQMPEKPNSQEALKENTDSSMKHIRAMHLEIIEKMKIDTTQ